MTPAITARPSATESVTATVTPSPAAPTVTPTLEAVQICSPLEGYGREQIEAAVAVPFHPPAAGLDDPHHGVDLAQMDANRVAVEGLPVQAVLAGRVAMVLADRFPYGNAILIETPLDDEMVDQLQGVPVPTPAPTLELRSALTCPALPVEPTWDSSMRSLYLLYAHLKEPPAVQPGQAVACGDTLGATGASGNALNPHLHLEVRVGPAGVSLFSMAHYDVSASAEEMANYCLWRVREVFQMLDPMVVLKLIQ